ncbi:SIR2 family NAD-dependent protein deacylase [Cognatilysobacter bugurensis]|uniref:NAD-dependent protein deacylase n=1 Tax=Cognatilysobacter bugurensis TaxID=543356 RepID=A0A918W9B6_9GAMM|nr:NAD-dependent deacylase [Lysobacter bugurensis]GHA80603.1 NAD-dependent protein deacylase 1 [Lysobacter bugurensis]
MATHFVFLTGAGMSAESGVPTFRDGLTGLWGRFDAETLATPQAFRRDPALVWGWYRWRAWQLLQVQPNAGHRGIAELARRGHRVDVVTQNVDDLHERAGSTEVRHLHGELLRSRCIDCSARAEPDPITLALDPPEGGAHETPPACTVCGGAFRPDVVWFGEALPEAEWEAGLGAIAACDRVVVVGTSGMVQPAASLPLVAREMGKPVLEINPQRSGVTPLVDEHWAMPASTGLQRLLDSID